MRWFAIGAVGTAASSASAFTAGATRDALVAIAAASAVLLAYLAARTERRLDEAHERILDLRYDVDQTAIQTNSLHTLFERPVRDRMNEEDYHTFVEPLERDIARAYGWVRSLIRR